MSLVYKSLFILIFCNFLYALDNSIESQPEVLFKYDKLDKIQKKFSLQVDFNKAVLLLSKNRYKKAIELFKKTEKIVYVPSTLNIGIAYYKMNSIDNAIIYLNKIYENKNFIKSNSFSYMSACFYLYEITKNSKYLRDIIKVSKKFKNLSEHSTRMLADTYVLLKDYNNALRVLKKIKKGIALKKSLIFIKLKDYEKAKIFLKKAKRETANPNTINDILWFETFVNIKANNIVMLKENLKEINKNRYLFKANQRLPLEMYFNEYKYTPKQYLDFVLNFNLSRQIDFIYYFAPFIFSDKQEILYDSIKGLINEESIALENLEDMVKYNRNFLDLVKLDPIIRVDKLKKLLGDNSKSYEYYNYALCCAQIYDFKTAFEYFKKAYKLNPGNKLYASMLLISALKTNKKLKDSEYIKSVIKSDKGLYNYFGKKLFKIFFNERYELKVKPKQYEFTIFYKSMNFLKKMKKGKMSLNNPLLDEHIRDPLTYLIRIVQRKEGENDLNYFSRLQESVPLNLNNNFLEGPLLITQYYIDVLKAIGLFFNADMRIIGKKTPSYLRTKALRDLHLNRVDESIKTIEYLQKEYKLENKYDMYLLVAALLKAGRYADASIQISLIKAILNDSDADFLTAVQLIQDLKLFSARQYLNKPYRDSLIDFRLVGFDDYLESL